MSKLTFFVILGFIIVGLSFSNTAGAVTAEEIKSIVNSYPEGYFTNANAGIKDSFLKSLDTIASNINLFNTETDPLFKSELGQEIHKGIEALISKTDGCIPTESNNPDAGDWLSNCQAQDVIYSKLNELLNSY